MLLSTSVWQNKEAKF
jgi:hypothetical protein